MSFYNSDLLVSPEWLSKHKDDSNLVIVDCPRSEDFYSRAHIPGAICRPGHPYVKAKDPDGKPTRLLPGPDEFKDLVKNLGIGPDTTVVLYDDFGSILATRLWWVLRYYGNESSKILNGGWQGWVSSGCPVSFKRSRPSSDVRPFNPSPKPDRLATLEELKEMYNDPSWKILDVRSDDEYYGKDAHGNKRVGHIPGALHLEWNLLLENSKDSEALRSFRSPDQIQNLLDKVGVNKDQTIVTHCQSGVRASLVAFALELLDYSTPRVYDGSMAEWANSDDTPLE